MTRWKRLALSFSISFVLAFAILQWHKRMIDRWYAKRQTAGCYYGDYRNGCPDGQQPALSVDPNGNSAFLCLPKYNKTGNDK